MSYQNGRLPDSALSPIYRGRLTHDAAASWNAMNAAARTRNIPLYPLGDASSYRTISQQLWLWDHVAHPHDTNWVARPGTSNHGWGIAVDLASRAMRWAIDQIGAGYGWAKRWSDAPGEWWHIRYRAGIFHAGPSRAEREKRVLKPLGKRQRRAAARLLYHRRMAIKQAKTGRGPRYRAQVVYRTFWHARVVRLYKRAGGARRQALSKTLRAKRGTFKEAV